MEKFEPIFEKLQKYEKLKCDDFIETLDIVKSWIAPVFNVMPKPAFKKDPESNEYKNILNIFEIVCRECFEDYLRRWRHEMLFTQISWLPRDFLKILIQYGMDVNYYAKKGFYNLHYTILSNSIFDSQDNFESTKLLLEHNVFNNIITFEFFYDFIDKYKERYDSMYFFDHSRIVYLYTQYMINKSKERISLLKEGILSRAQEH